MLNLTSDIMTTRSKGLNKILKNLAPHSLFKANLSPPCRPFLGLMLFCLTFIHSIDIVTATKIIPAVMDQDFVSLS